MTTSVATERPEVGGDGVSVLERYRWSGPAAALSVYLVARALSAAAFVWAAADQPATQALRRAGDFRAYFVFAPTPASPSYAQLMTNWDGQWYQYIATQGYLPATLDPSPQAEHAWAFPPGYPMLVRAVMRVTGLPFETAAPMLSVVLGAAAMVVLYVYLRSMGGSFLAFTGVATTSFFVSAPLFQAAYSESLALLILVSALFAAARGRWWAASLLTVSLSFVRLISPPLALVGALVAVRRVRSGQRSVGALAGPLVFSATALAGPFLWPWISQQLLHAGGGDGADRASSAVRGYTFGWFGTFAEYAPWLLVPLVLVVVLLLRIMLDPRHRHWGHGTRIWGWSYPLFVLLVTEPMTGFIRYMLLAFPLGLPLAGNATRPNLRRIVGLVLACGALQVAQVFWIKYVFVVQEQSFIP